MLEACFKLKPRPPLEVQFSESLSPDFEKVLTAAEKFGLRCARADGSLGATSSDDVDVRVVVLDARY